MLRLPIPRCAPALLALPVALLACSPPENSVDACVGGKCDDPREGVDDEELVAFACDSAFVNKSSRRNPDGSQITRFVDRLKDPLTLLAYQGQDCPITMADIIELMKANESDCGENDGLATRVISEEGQILDSQFASYRGVTTKECNERKNFDLMFSIFGLGADSQVLPTSGIEVIARDDVTGVFNYYKEIDGKMGFFGSGLDYLFDGHGDFLTDENGCGLCHASNSEKSGRGNLNMKERRNPWLHWEGSAETAGADELIERFAPTLGIAKTGPNLESIVKAGNRANNGAIIDALVAGREYERLLGPLFCTEQLNIATGSRNRVPASFLTVPRLGPSNISVSGSTYDKFLVASQSLVAGTDIRDTRFAFAYLERSFDDINYVDQLIDKNIIDEQFALDVLAIQFTRPVFSDARCDLLEFAPTSSALAAAELGPERLRDAFLANLGGQAAGTPGADLLAHFTASKDGTPFNHKASVGSFLTACEMLHETGVPIGFETPEGNAEISPFQLNAMKIRSRNLQLAVEFDSALNNADGSDERPRAVFEFARTFAFDQIGVSANAAAANPTAVHPDAHFNPVDCTLATEYVALAAE